MKPFSRPKSSLKSATAAIVPPFGELAKEQGIELTYEQPEQAIQIWADPDLLRQVIENFLSFVEQQISP